MLAVHCPALSGSFHYVDAARTCSWYEYHHLGGCQRSAPRAGCTQAQLRRASERGAAQRLAILIPFRGSVNDESFSSFCSSLPAHLRDQGTNFHLLAVNQIDEHPFNRAALANAAFRVLNTGGRRAGLRASDRQPFTCIAVHDVDRFPSIQNRSCAPFSRHYYTCNSFSPVVLHPESYTGGVLLMRPALFRAVNGFSNAYWGWGHEDNDFYLRLRACGRPPVHAPELDWCMQHRDCERCKRAKPSGGLQALRAETKSIALVHSRIADPLRYAVDDGVDDLNFTTASRPVALPCGQHTLHVLDVRLQRKVVRRASVTDAYHHGGDEAAPTCTADGGANDDGCVAHVDAGALPPRLVARARRVLPPNARFRRVVGATRQRTMYNFNYEVDIEADMDKPQPALVRIALCAQEWQARDVPDSVRYQPLWRAIATGRQHKFRLAKNFTYKGHFPCALRAPPGLAAPT